MNYCIVSDNSYGETMFIISIKTTALKSTAQQPRVQPRRQVEPTKTEQNVIKSDELSNNA